MDLESYVCEIWRVRPNITIVGTSVADHREGFSARGIDLFLYKPWSVGQLLEALASKVDQ